MAGFNNATDFYPRITGQLTVYPGPINQVTATVDNNVGTPHVDVQTEYTADGMNINFDFHDMGIPGTDLTVLQPLTEQQKANARQNINAQEVLTFDSAPTQGSQNPVTSGGVYAAEQAIAADVADIEAVIPAAATSQNQLADKEYVDDSINRSSAFFRGNFETRAALMAVPWQTTDPDAPNYVSNNDYAYVADDETHEDESWRYIYVLEEGGSNNGWAAQYRVNESPLTTEQLAAINSGITSAGVAQIETNRTGLASHVADHSNPHQVTKAQVGLGNVDNTSDADKPISTAQQAALDALKDDINSLYDPETASGDIVTIEDADPVLVDELVVDIQPTQDLHGQANPYPAGGGKNKLPLTLANLKAINTAGTWSGNVYSLYSVTFTVNVDSGDNILGIDVNGTSTGGNAALILATDYSGYSVGDILNGCPADGGTSTYKLSAFGNGTSVEDRGSGVALSVAGLSTIVMTIYSGVTANHLLFKPMVRQSTETSDFVPYSNICPISGWTGAKINVDGVNVWDEEWEICDWSSSDGSKIAGPHFSSKNKIPVKPSASYYFASPAGQRYRWLEYGADDSYKGYHDFNGGNFTVGPDTYYVTFMMATTYGQTYNNDISINYPSTDTSYHAYNGSTVNIDWTDEAGTVYGGTLTYIGGGKYSLQPTYYYIPDLSALNWTYRSAYTFFTSQINAQGLGLPRPKDKGLCVSSAYKYSVRAFADDFSCMLGESGFFLDCAIIHDSRYTDATAFKAALSGVSLAYEYAVLPSPIILDAEDIELLEGTNNIFADAGPITVKFAKGALAKVISNLTARINALEAQA